MENSIPTAAAMRASRSLMKNAPFRINEQIITRNASTIDLETTLPNLIASAQRVIEAHSTDAYDFAEAINALKRAVERTEKGNQ